MGRLTLNMLLSFAQFEREVTAERIRDKFKASKQKGMFMGGAVPMGYVVKDRHLHIDPNGSKTVKQVFNAYLTLGCLTKVEDWLKTNDIKTPVWLSRNGNSKGGRYFSYGHIYAVLTNPIYIGKVKHYDAVYDSQHDAIIDDNMWEEVQTNLQSKASVNRNQKYQTGKHCLAGIIYDETGDRLTPSGSNKNGVRHLYYVSSRISKGNAKEHPDAWRLPAIALETFMLKTVLHHIEGSLWTDDISTADNVKCKISALFSKDDWSRYISKITVHGRKVEIIMSHKRIVEDLEYDIDKSQCTIIAPFHMGRKANGKKVLIGTSQNDLDLGLLKLYIQARKWYGLLCTGNTFIEISKNETVSDSYIRRMICMAFLSPDVVKQLSEGKQSIILSKEWIKKNGLPDDWQEQVKLLNAY